MFEVTRSENVLRLERQETRWLSTGLAGGFSHADAGYLIEVPANWNPPDPEEGASRRLETAGFEETGPVLLSALDLDHTRGATYEPVVVYATAGLSNPAALPMEPTGQPETLDRAPPGTVNLLVGSTRALDDAAMANLIAVGAEAKAATLLAVAGFPGTTSDAVVCAADPAGEPARFTGSATAVGAATRACVREAVLASLRSRYEDEALPESIDTAEYGVTTNRRADVFRP